jgi:hypothetical protein
MAGITAEMTAAIQRVVRPASLPDGTPYDSIGTADVAGIAGEFQRAGWDVERTALENQVWPERYTRNMKTFSPADQARLLGATVTVVGLGGLGGTVTEILARVGIGALRLVDGDRFDESNLNRQLYGTVDRMGMAEGETARRRVARVNPSIAVSSHEIFLDQDSTVGLLEESDVAVDGPAGSLCLPCQHKEISALSGKSKSGGKKCLKSSREKRWPGVR